MTLLSLQINPAAWPWHRIATLVSLLVMAWVFVRGRRSLSLDSKVSPRPVASSWMFTAIVAAVGALHYSIAMRQGGPLVNGDALRDAFNGLDIARNGARLAIGPYIAGLDCSLGPLWYYILSVPLRLDTPLALPIAVVAWQTLTLGVLYATAQRLLGPAIAATTCALFVVCGAVTDNYAYLTHSNLSFLCALLAIAALHEFQGAGRSYKVVSLFFWTSLAMQLHFTGVLLAPAAIAASLARRNDATIADTVMALVAGLAPFLSTIPAVPGVHLGSWPTLLVEFARSNNAVVPVLLASLVCARPRSLLSWPGLLFLLVSLALWLGCVLDWGAANAGSHLTLRFLNFSFTPSNAQASPMGPDEDWRRVGALLLRYGTDEPIDRMIALLFALGGLLTWVRAARGAIAHSQRVVIERGAATVLLATLGILLPAAILVVALTMPFSRYLAQGVLPLLLLIATGVIAWWQLTLRDVFGGVRSPDAAIVRALSVAACCVLFFRHTPMWAALLLPIAARLVPSRNRMLVTAIVTPALALVVVLAVSSDNDRDRGMGERLMYGYRLVRAAALVPAIGIAGLETRVHGALDERVALLDARTSSMLLFEQLALLSLSSATPTQGGTQGADPMEFRLAPLTDTRRDRASVAGTQLSFLPYSPALATSEAKALVTGEGRSRALQQPFALPFRAAAPGVYPHTFRPPLRMARDLLRPGGDGISVQVEIPRDVPTDASLDGVEVDLGAMGSDEHCDLRVEIAGAPITAEIGSGRWTRVTRFRLPPYTTRSMLRFTVAGCQVSYFDVFDVQTH